MAPRDFELMTTDSPGEILISTRLETSASAFARSTSKLLYNYNGVPELGVDRLHAVYSHSLGGSDGDGRRRDICIYWLAYDQEDLTR